LYVQQSSLHQVMLNKKGSALQYAMRGRLTRLGRSDIDTVDDDLGRSASGSADRAGFERMVAKVCLGAVAARSSRDWQQLIEMCRVVDTVLIDRETIDAPRQSNDTLLPRVKVIAQQIQA
jgi:DNA invertase Pin-like site-specific DNA recombinase